MKLKTIYVLIWILLGIICSLFFSFLFLSTASAFLDNVIFNNAVWPAQKHIIPAILSILIFILINLWFVSIGIRRGEKCSRIYDKTKKGIKTAYIILGISFVLVFLCSSMVVLYIKHIKQIDYEIKSNIIKISSISMQRRKDGFDIIVNIAGKSSDEYSLEINIDSNRYIRTNLVHIYEKIPLKFEKQIFRFFISFKDIEDVYYKKLLDDFAFNPKVKTYIDEDADVSIILTLDKSLRYSKEELARNNIVPDIKRAIAKFYFECFKDKCKITQKDDNLKGLKK